MTNLQTLIENTKKEFDDQFLTNPDCRMVFATGDEKREMSKFLETKMREAAEEAINTALYTKTSLSGKYEGITTINFTTSQNQQIINAKKFLEE